MCSPILGCVTRSVNKPVWVTTTENNNPLRDISNHHDSRQTSPGPFSRLALRNTLPLYKPDPPSFGTEDYDYTLAEPTSSTIQDLARPLESTTVLPTYPESSSTSFSSHDDRRHELRDTQKSLDPERSSKDEVTHNMDPTTTGAQRETSTLLTTTPAQKVTTENHRPQQEIGERSIRHNRDRNRVVQDTSLKDTTYTARLNKGGRHSGHHKHSQGSSHSVNHKGQENVSMEHRRPLGKEEQGSYPTIQFSPTSRAPVRMREDGEQPERQAQTLHNYQSQDEEGDAEGKLHISRLTVFEVSLKTIIRCPHEY